MRALIGTPLIGKPKPWYFPTGGGLGGGPIGGLSLLKGEAQGLGVDFSVAAGPNAGFGSVAVKDTTTPGNNKNNVPASEFFTQSGTSPKLVLWSDGLYRWSPHNLLLRSEDLTNASWTKSATTAPTATRIQEDGSTGGHSVAASDTLIAGPTYTYWVEASAAERTKIMLYGLSAISQGRGFDLTNGTTFAVDTISSAGLTYGVTDLGGGRYRCWISFVSAGTSGGATYLVNGTAFSYAGDNASGVTIYRSGMNRGTSPLTYHVTTSAAWFGVPIEWDGVSRFYALVEPAATNLNTQSQGLASADWTKTNSTIGSAAAVAPDGLTMMEGLIENTTNGQHRVLQNIATTAAAYTASAYLKKGTRDWAALSLVDSGDTARFVWFNLNTGVVGTAQTGMTGTITSVGNGIYRCTATIGTAFNGTRGFQVNATDVDNNLNYVGVNSATAIYAWQEQVELGSVATSPIPTFAATVTRAQDAVSAALTTIPGLGSAYSMMMEMASPDIATSAYRLTLGNADNNNAAVLGTAQNTAANAGQVVRTGGSTVANTDAGVIVANTYFKSAARFVVNDFAVSRNGAVPVADTSGALPVTPGSLYIGGEAGTVVVGKFRTVVVVPRAYTNAELQARTA